jgi:hypothetical protein
VGWEISANLGVYARPGVDARGWLWELARDGAAAQVVVELTGSAWSSFPPNLPEDTRQALETDGRTEVLKVLDDDVPPLVIQCGSLGCTRIVGS